VFTVQATGNVLFSGIGYPQTDFGFFFDEEDQGFDFSEIFEWLDLKTFYFCFCSCSCSCFYSYFSLLSTNVPWEVIDFVLCEVIDFVLCLSFYCPCDHDFYSENQVKSDPGYGSYGLDSNSDSSFDFGYDFDSNFCFDFDSNSDFCFDSDSDSYSNSDFCFDFCQDSRVLDAQNDNKDSILLGL